MTTTRPELPLIAGEREMMRGFIDYHRATRTIDGTVGA